MLRLWEKKRIDHLWKKGQATWEEYKDVARIHREKIRKVKAQQESNLAIIIKNKNTFPRILTARGESPS